MQGGGEDGEAGAGCEAGSCLERGGGRPFSRNFRGSCYSAWLAEQEPSETRGPAAYGPLAPSSSPEALQCRLCPH